MPKVREGNTIYTRAIDDDDDEDYDGEMQDKEVITWRKFVKMKMYTERFFRFHCYVSSC